MMTVFIAAAPYQFDSAIRLEQELHDCGHTILNPTVSLPLNVPCRLTIEIAMLEASDILYVIASKTSNEILCLMSYAREQHIPIVTSVEELFNAIDKYPQQQSFLKE